MQSLNAKELQALRKGKRSFDHIKVLERRGAYPVNQRYRDSPPISCTAMENGTSANRRRNGHTPLHWECQWTPSGRNANRASEESCTEGGKHDDRRNATLFEQLVKAILRVHQLRWCETNQVKPPYPLVALKLTNVSRSVHPTVLFNLRRKPARCYLYAGLDPQPLHTGKTSISKPGMTTACPQYSSKRFAGILFATLIRMQDRTFSLYANLYIIPEEKRGYQLPVKRQYL